MVLKGYSGIFSDPFMSNSPDIPNLCYLFSKSYKCSTPLTYWLQSLYISSSGAFDSVIILSKLNQMHLYITHSGRHSWPSY